MIYSNGDAPLICAQVLSFAMLSIVFVAAASILSRAVGGACALRAVKREFPHSGSGVLPERQCKTSRIGTIVLVSALLVSMLQDSFWSAAFVLATGFVAACSVESDMGYGYLPNELTVALMVLGICFRIEDPPSLVFGVVAGTAMMVVSFLANRFAKGDDCFVVGGGDVRMMFALSVVTGEGCFIGCLACCVAALIWAFLFGCGKSSFPMAPFFAIWLFLGLAI